MLNSFTPHKEPLGLWDLDGLVGVWSNLDPSLKYFSSTFLYYSVGNSLLSKSQLQGERRKRTECYCTEILITW